MGPTRGFQPTPYRAEGVGLLSLLRFLTRLAEYCGKFDEWHGIIATDSKSILDTLFGVEQSKNDCQAIKKLNEIETLSPDSDVIVELQAALAALPGITLRHIKGHQDRKTSYDRLSLLAQLNVDADHLAGEYQQTHGCEKPPVLMSPNVRAHFVQEDVNITSNIATHIRHQSSCASLMEYIKRQQNWSETTLRSVNWEAHGKSMRNELPHRIHLVKLVHNILPINANIHRRHITKSQCLSCQNGIEDWTHVLRCPDESRSRWRGSLMTDLRAKCINEHTCPRVQDLLLDALRTWLDAPPPNDVPSRSSTLFLHVDKVDQPTECHRLVGTFPWTF